MTMLILIAAVADNGVIGIDNRLPWHLSTDLQYFKRTTRHHTVLMGRKTFESIGKPLVDRRNIVITRNMDWQHEGCDVFHRIDAALASCQSDGQIFVIGGEAIFKATFALATHLYLTEIHQPFAGNIFFPTYDKTAWKEVSRLPQQEGEVSFDFVVYKRLT